MLESVSTSVFVDLGNSLDLRERSNLIELDKRLHEHWALGKNFVLGWVPYQSGLLLLVVPHYAIADYAISTEIPPADITVSDSDPHAFHHAHAVGVQKISLSVSLGTPVVYSRRSRFTSNCASR